MGQSVYNLCRPLHDLGNLTAVGTGQDRNPNKQALMLHVCVCVRAHTCLHTQTHRREVRTLLIINNCSKHDSNISELEGKLSKVSLLN